MTMQEFEIFLGGGGQPVSEEEIEAVAQEFSDENTVSTIPAPDIYGEE